jgi:hypothetical protein
MKTYRNPDSRTNSIIEETHGETLDEAKDFAVQLIYELDRNGELTGIKNITRGKIRAMLDELDK